ncbi:toxin glutamine deamidase domain-containing protein [Acidovorax sp. NCPPB 4044]|uniref:toxin glutamine deamidase domain-containing protein n=1 Tax=Acidovorax sp. NCPPB 4044 TaxID=2940490 RepID=UPI0023033563|nr:toxin glutamine deamidase domain-containing protein [Acidovorax sp. NCPPB 4044]MDA8523441.1 toxin glutamine deamidase domain-containing protein [Acidovorax sp. NCPPB 4044]
MDVSRLGYEHYNHARARPAGYTQSGDIGIRSYGEAVRFDLRCPGQVWDEETGLSYNLHRYYERFGLPTTNADVINSMINAGNGARGIAYGAPLTGSVGHVFNVVNQNGVVRYLDGQTGRAASIDGYRYLQLLRTN